MPRVATREAVLHSLSIGIGSPILTVAELVLDEVVILLGGLELIVRFAAGFMFRFIAFACEPMTNVCAATVAKTICVVGWSTI